MTLTPSKVTENEIRVTESPPSVLTLWVKTAGSSNSSLLFDLGHKCFLYSMDEIRVELGCVNLQLKKFQIRLDQVQPIWK